MQMIKKWYQIWSTSRNRTLSSTNTDTATRTHAGTPDTGLCILCIDMRPPEDKMESTHIDIKLSKNRPISKTYGQTLLLRHAWTSAHKKRHTELYKTLKNTMISRTKRLIQCCNIISVEYATKWTRRHLKRHIYDNKRLTHWTNRHWTTLLKPRYENVFAPERESKS